MNNFTPVPAENLNINPFAMGKEWMLIAASDGAETNMLTASWGGFGFMWRKNIMFVVIRPSRHTYGLIEKTDTFSVCVFDEKYREQLNFCGSHSGRDTDKIARCGFNVLHSGNTPYFAQARRVYIVRKMYFHDLEVAGFLDPSIEGFYNGSDYHRMYVGEITDILEVDSL